MNRGHLANWANSLGVDAVAEPSAVPSPTVDNYAIYRLFAFVSLDRLRGNVLYAVLADIYAPRHRSGTDS